MISRRNVLKCAAAVPLAGLATGPTASVARQTDPGNTKRGRGPSLDTPIGVKWRFDQLGPIYTPPAVADGTVYLGKQGGYLFALDAITGDERWRASIGYQQPLSPIVHNGMVYITTVERLGGMLQAFDVQTGTERWSFGGDGLHVSNPVIEHDVVYASLHETFYALDANTGAERWREDYTIVSPRAVLDGVVYGIDYTAQGYRFLDAYDTATRSIRWRTSTIDDVAAFTLTDGTVYLGSRAGDFRAFDAVSGTERWTVMVGEGLRSNATVDNGLVFVDGPSSFLALDIDSGETRWTFASGTDVAFSTQAVADGVVYAGSLDRLFALDAATGEELWRFGTDNAVGGPAVAVGEHMVFAVTDSTNLVALGNIASPTLVADVTILGAPSRTGVVRGTAQAGQAITRVGAREIGDDLSWAEVTVDGVTGWIPFTAIDPATLPPEGEIEYVYTPN